MSAIEATSPWGQRTLSLDSARKWTWFQEFFAAALISGSTAVSGAAVDRTALAAAFWRWVGMLDSEARFEKVDPCDFIHYAAGQLLRCVLTERPLRLLDRQRSEEVRAMTQTVLSLLREWRCALHSEYIQTLELPAECDSLWAGYLEDTAKDSAVAVAYLDKFCGLEPDWMCPQLIVNRPAMRAKLKSRRISPASAGD